jgi:hypothetical protein
MGSIVSFLILCLANLGVTLAATAQEDPRPWRARIKGVLINGDDNGFICTKRFYQTFCQWSEACGLKMSVGKAYWHPKIFNINSQCFHFSLVDPTATPKTVAYLNTGLFFGKGKVLEKDNEVCKRRMTAVIDRVLEGSLPGKQSDLLKMYISRHSAAIATECNGRNLFLPLILGGMGVYAPGPTRVRDGPYAWRDRPGFKFHVTAEQRVLGGILWEREPCMTISAGGPQQSVLPGDLPPKYSAPWLAEGKEVWSPPLDALFKFVNGNKWKRIVKGGKLSNITNSDSMEQLWKNIDNRVMLTASAPLCRLMRVPPGFRFNAMTSQQIKKPHSVGSTPRHWVFQERQGPSLWLKEYLDKRLVGSVYSQGELARTAQEHGFGVVVQHRDRDVTISDDVTCPWARAARSMELDLEMDHDLSAFMAGVRSLEGWD